MDKARKAITRGDDSVEAMKMSKCSKSPNGTHAVRMGPESVSKYITQELRKGRKLQEILRDVEDCQFCIYCGEPIW